MKRFVFARQCARPGSAAPRLAAATRTVSHRHKRAPHSRQLMKMHACGAAVPCVAPWGRGRGGRAVWKGGGGAGPGRRAPGGGRRVSPLGPRPRGAVLEVLGQTRLVPPLARAHTPGRPGRAWSRIARPPPSPITCSVFRGAPFRTMGWPAPCRALPGAARAQPQSVLTAHPGPATEPAADGRGMHSDPVPPA